MNILKIPNQVIKGKLKSLVLPYVDSIVLHHIAHQTAGVKDVENWHINKGWDAIGYNYFVALDGTVYQGRGLKVGAGVFGHNEHIISIAFQGDYEKQTAMPDAQFNAGIKLIKYIKTLLPYFDEVKGHRDFGGSVCPGKYFPLDEMKALKEREETEMVYNYIDENMPEWARSTIQKLVDKGYLKGDENGELGLNDTMLKLLVINDRAGLYK